MAQQYYEYVNYKEEHVQEQKKLPKGACHRYIIVFQSIFNGIFNVSLLPAFIQTVSGVWVVLNSCRSIWSWVPTFSLFLLSWVLYLQSSPCGLFLMDTWTPTTTSCTASKPVVITPGALHSSTQLSWALTLGKRGAYVTVTIKDDNCLHISQSCV